MYIFAVFKQLYSVIIVVMSHMGSTSHNTLIILGSWPYILRTYICEQNLVFSMCLCTLYAFIYLHFSVQKDFLLKNDPVPYCKILQFLPYHYNNISACVNTLPKESTNKKSVYICYAFNSFEIQHINI